MGNALPLEVVGLFDGWPRWAYEVLFACYAILVMGLVLSERRRPTATLAWILALIFVPLLGLAFYLVFGRSRVRRRRRRRARQALRPFEDTYELARVADVPATLSPVQADLVRLALRLAAAPLRRARSLTVLDHAEAIRASLFEAIAAAQHYVHLEFYIWKDDASGRALTRLLAERARAGVRVRILYDFVGSLGLPASHFAELVEAGGEALPFEPVRIPLPHRLHHLNFRNHRKIVVVDGDVGFLGGANVGDEYLASAFQGGAWHDLMFRIEGDAVLSLATTFDEDWITATGEVLDLEGRTPAEAARADARKPPRDRVGPPTLAFGSRRRRLPRNLAPYPPPEARPARSEGPLVQIIPSGPDREVVDTIALQVVAAITAARRRLLIATAYFVPDEPTMAALRTAALRGVDVRILLPSPRTSDQPWVGFAARSYYDDLLAAGCRIFEFGEGMLHAKCMVIDDDVTLVGSANMDVRSFYVNYEITALVYGSDTSRRIAELFEGYVARSKEISLEGRATQPWSRRIAENVARTLSPLL
ncbi:MAG: hypothetical protein D6705_06395 [Deltaproteobacteria bacterium]|nr:MAG: hypothetical protein D6705_06395 [Deltaproteobacteria bacterium]